MQVKLEKQVALKKYLPEIESSGLSVVGPVREDNQDSIHLTEGEQAGASGWLFAVADGMGGYAHGGVASLLAIQSFPTHCNREMALRYQKPWRKASRLPTCGFINMRSAQTWDAWAQH